jgi:hypothetical protein
MAEKNNDMFFCGVFYVCLFRCERMDRMAEISHDVFPFLGWYFLSEGQTGRQIIELTFHFQFQRFFMSNVNNIRIKPHQPIINQQIETNR